MSIASIQIENTAYRYVQVWANDDTKYHTECYESSSVYLDRTIRYTSSNYAIKDEFGVLLLCMSTILTTNWAACVCVCVFVCAHNFTNFCPYALISSPNVPKILFA